MSLKLFIFIFCYLYIQAYGLILDRQGGLERQVKNLPKNETVLKAPEFLAPDGLKPCSCGIFMSGQIKPRQQPSGYPLVVNEFEDHLQCNSLGVRQCQTKCMEEMIKHLSGTGNGASACILLDRDAYKERAYLFVKNCDNDWHPTRLSSGKELCCKDGKQYKCPLI